MEVSLILADAARAHPDNTFSLLRGGITSVDAPRNGPIVFKGALVARVTGTPAESGRHEFKVVCVGKDGGRVGPNIAGDFSIPSEGGAIQVVIDMNVAFPTHGSYEFTVMIDNRPLAGWPLETREAPA